MAEWKDTLIKTDIDRLMELLRDRGSVSVAQAADLIGVEDGTVLTWAQSLEEAGLLEINYSATRGKVLSLPAEPEEAEKAKEDVEREVSRKLDDAQWGIERAKLTRLEEALSKLERTLHRDKDRAEALQDRIEELEEFDVDAEVEAYEADLDDAEAEIAALEETIESVKDDLRVLATIEQHAGTGRGIRAKLKRLLPSLPAGKLPLPGRSDDEETAADEGGADREESHADHIGHAKTAGDILRERDEDAGAADDAAGAEPDDGERAPDRDADADEDRGTGADEPEDTGQGGDAAEQAEAGEEDRGGAADAEAEDPAPAPAEAETDRSGDGPRAGDATDDRAEQVQADGQEDGPEEDERDAGEDQPADGGAAETASDRADRAADPDADGGEEDAGEDVAAEQAETASADADVDYDAVVQDHTVPEVKKAVFDRGLDLEAVLAAERRHDDRVTLTDWLEEQLAEAERATELVREALADAPGVAAGGSVDPDALATGAAVRRLRRLVETRDIDMELVIRAAREHPADVDLSAVLDGLEGDDDE